MHREFWLGLWKRGRVPFHWPVANPLLVAHAAALRLAPGARVFVPLCGRSVDVGWLRARGFRVVGVELSELAVGQLFDTLGEAPGIADFGAVRRYAARDVEVFAGDVFDLTAEVLGQVDAVYDRAALIALPSAVRPRYAAHVVALAGPVPQLLVGMESERAGQADGPPFVVTGDEIARLYTATHRPRLLARTEPDEYGELDAVWLLDPLPG